MARSALLPLFHLVLQCALSPRTTSRHVHAHRRPVHIHARQTLDATAASSASPLLIETFSPIAVIQTAPAPTLTTASAVTAGDKVMSDIAMIEQGLSDLPQDLFAFISAVEQRLQQVESEIESLTNMTGAPQSVITPVPQIPSASSSTSSSFVPWDEWLTDTSVYSGFTTSIISSTTVEGIAAPSPDDTAMTTMAMTTSTITSTSSRTITLHEPIPAKSTSTLQKYNGSSVAGTMAQQPQSTVTVVPWPVNTSLTPATAETVFRTTAAPSPTASYVFSADSADNVAVYYGQTPTTSVGGLSELCGQDDVDIVILAFVYDFYGPGGYPSVSFAAGCNGSSAGQTAAGATGLLDCSELADEIQTCQHIGKRVFLSLGGAIANTTLESDEEAEDVAETLWQLFGGGTIDDDTGLRPFGPNTVVDGFDIDNESHDSAHYDTLATSLRKLFTTDTARTFYLSAAPQCPRPDESIPLGLMAVADFVWVQFFNNPSCNLDSTDFQESFVAWSQNLSAISSTPGSPKLYIGAAAWEGAGTGYVVGTGLATLIGGARALNVSNLGGLMLWDGSEGLANVDQAGNDYLFYAKRSLE